MQYDKNPFPEGDADRHYLWEMLVRRDIDAFIEAALAERVGTEGKP